MFNNFYPKNHTVHKVTWKKHGTARQATDGNIMWTRKDAICMNVK